MQLERNEFLKAFNFLKPAMGSDKNAEDYRNYVHVRIDGVKCTLTTANFRHGKRVILEKPDVPIDMEADQLENPEDVANQYDFLINRSNLESFATLCQKHKGKLEKAAKKDLTLSFIDIFPDVLESHKTRIRYMQPTGIVFPNYDRLFHKVIFPPDHLKIDTDHLIDVLKGFSTNAEFYFGSENYPLSIQSPCENRKAFIFYEIPKNEQI